jgi:hypothetical protein
MSSYAYPPDVAAALPLHWPPHGYPLPSQEVLTELLAVAYQASLLQEETRPVLGHLLLAPEHILADPSHRSARHQVLRFTRALPYRAQELRRLSPTVQRPGHLLAVEERAGQGLVIWGMVLTTRPWDYAHEPADPAYLPPALYLHLFGSGNLGLFCGAERVLVLQQGRLLALRDVQFPTAWVRNYFNEVSALQVGTPTSLTLARALTRHMTRRLIAQVQAAGHGGMVLLVASDRVAQLVGEAGLLVPKYGVQTNEVGTRYLALLEQAVARCLELGLDSWTAYRLSTDGLLQTLHAELDHFADLLADLMAVDGALVLNKQFEVVGFGVELRAPALPTTCVYRALDPEATQLQAEAANSGGTRHRAAYRLCQAEPECLALVVSQDGGVKFVRQQAGQIVFWEQPPV